MKLKSATLRSIQNALAEVCPRTEAEWSDGFRCSRDTGREVQFWRKVAKDYSRQTRAKGLTLPAKKSTFASIMLSAVCSRKGDDVQDVYRQFRVTQAPPTAGGLADRQEGLRAGKRWYATAGRPWVALYQLHYWFSLLGSEWDQFFTAKQTPGGLSLPDDPATRVVYFLSNHFEQYRKYSRFWKQAAGQPEPRAEFVRGFVQGALESYWKEFRQKDRPKGGKQPRPSNKASARSSVCPVESNPFGATNSTKRPDFQTLLFPSLN